MKSLHFQSLLALLCVGHVRSAAVSTSCTSTSTVSTSTVSTSTVSTSTATSTSSGNTASDRSTWGDYDLTTDYYNVVPDTGVTREYWFDLIQTTASPDGYERMVLTVNGTVPGPTIFADWGDTVVVHVSEQVSNFYRVVAANILFRLQTTSTSARTALAFISTVFARTRRTKWMELSPSRSVQQRLARV